MKKRDGMETTRVEIRQSRMHSRMNEKYSGRPEPK